jgi:hypothetical protein
LSAASAAAFASVVVDVVLDDEVVVVVVLKSGGGGKVSGLGPGREMRMMATTRTITASAIPPMIRNRFLLLDGGPPAPGPSPPNPSPPGTGRTIVRSSGGGPCP